MGIEFGVTLEAAFAGQLSPALKTTPIYIGQKAYYDL